LLVFFQNNSKTFDFTGFFLDFLTIMRYTIDKKENKNNNKLGVQDVHFQGNAFRRYAGHVSRFRTPYQR
jgi:hypothetical protein